MATPKYTIHDFNRGYPDDDACFVAITEMLYPEGMTCRTCERVRPHSRITGRRAYACAGCGTHVYPLAGTIFAKSTTPLKSWFYAMYLMASTRCGISAKQLERELGVTYKTAWRMFTQIRKLMAVQVRLRAYGGEVITRTVVREEDGIVVVCRDAEFVLAGREGREPRVVGFPKADVIDSTT